jgi:hypothetical protein
VLGFPLNVKDKDGHCLVLSGGLGIVMFWSSIAVLVGEATAPFWATAAFSQRIWPRVSVLTWAGVGPGLTGTLAVVFLLSLIANCRRQSLLAGLMFVAGYAMMLIAIWLKTSLMYANKA